MICVDPRRVHEVWPHVRDKIKLAIEATGLSAFEDIEYDVLSGDQLVWLAWDDGILAAATTRLTRGICEIVSCSGEDRKQWLPLLDQIESYARKEGCSATRIIGRMGWERVLKGYRRKHVILEKPL